MNAANKSPLLRNSFKLLLSSLQAKDTRATITCAGEAGFALEPTTVQDQGRIIAALAQLRPGATNFQIATPVGASLALKGIGNAPTENRFPTAVVAFGQLLRWGLYTQDYDYADVSELAHGA